MGGSQSQPFLHELANYKVIQKIPEYNMTHLSHVETDKQYLLRQHSYNDQNYYSKCLNDHKARKLIQDQHLTHLLRVEGKEQDHLCSNLYKIFAIWQYPYRTLEDQIHERVHQNRKFQDKQVWSILASSILGLSILQKNKLKHQMITTRNILLDSDGILKIADPLACGSATNLQVINRNRSVQNIYISPEQCQSLQTRSGYNSYKSDVWTMGMVVLECGLLENLSICYKDEFQRIDHGMIIQKLEQFGKQYGEQLKTILEFMLKFDSKDRPDWIDLVQYTRKNNQISKNNINNPPQLSPVTKVQQPSSYSVLPHSAQNQPQKVTNDQRLSSINLNSFNTGHVSYSSNVHNKNLIPQTNSTINIKKNYYNPPNVTFNSSSQNLMAMPVGVSRPNLSPHHYVLQNNMPIYKPLNPIPIPNVHQPLSYQMSNTTASNIGINRSFQPLMRPTQHQSPSRAISPSPNRTTAFSNQYTSSVLAKQNHKHPQTTENKYLSSLGIGSKSYQQWKNSVADKSKTSTFNYAKFDSLKNDVGKLNQTKPDLKFNIPNFSNQLFANPSLPKQSNAFGLTNSSTPSGSLTPRPLGLMTHSLLNKYQGFNDTNSLYTSPQLLAYIGLKKGFGQNEPNKGYQAQKNQFTNINVGQNNYLSLFNNYAIQPQTYSNKNKETIQNSKQSQQNLSSPSKIAPTNTIPTFNNQFQNIYSNNIQSISQHIVTTQSHQKVTNSPQYSNKQSKQSPVKQNSVQKHQSNPNTKTNRLSNESNQKPEYVIQTFKQGSRYEGQKLKDMRHGKGKFFYQDGGMYDGSWKMNKMDGFGSLYYQSGSLAYQGMWKQDQFQGKGKLYNQYPYKLQDSFNYQNFDEIDQFWQFYQGQFIEDLKKGKGILMLSNGQYFQGVFQNDMVEGPGVFYCRNGQVVKGVWQQNHLVSRS